MTGFSSLDELARRPDDPVLILQHPETVDPSTQREAAQALYGGFVVITCSGIKAHARSLAERDCVLWPWQTPSNRRDCNGLVNDISSYASRLRVIRPEDPADWVSPSEVPKRVNGHGSAIEWARQNCIEVPRHDPEPDPVYERPPLVSDYHPAMIDEPDPVDLFTKRVLPALKRDDLPPAIAAFVFDQSAIIGSDPCILAVSCLVTAAACIHDDIKLQATRNNTAWTESARLWGMFIGDPSVKKTPALNRAIGQLKKLNVDMAEQSAADLESYKRELKAHERSEQAQYKNQSSNRSPGYAGPPPMRPLNKRIIVQDATPEAIAVIMKDNPGGLLSLHDELSGFFGGIDAYRAKGDKDTSFWLECYNGGPRSVDRIGRDSITISNMSACVLGGIQPSTLSKISAKLPDDGLMQRFIVVIAQSVDGIGEDRAPIAGTTEQWSAIVDWLVPTRAKHDRQPTLSDEGLRIRESLERHIKTLQAAHCGTPKLVAHLGKWPALFVRLCLVYHAIECAVMARNIDGEVSGENAKRVARFMMDYLYEHTRSLHEDLMGESWVSDAARWIAGFIVSRELSEISMRTIYRSYKALAARPEKDRGPVMRALELTGWLTPNKGNNPGVPIASWTVNPRVHELFSHHKQVEIDARATAREIVIARRSSEKARRNEQQD